MRNFNLNSVTKHVRSSGFTVAQEEFFLDCQLEALGKQGPGTGLTPSLENAGAGAAILGGLIGGLIGLLWGIYDHFFGKKKALDVTMDKFEFTFSTEGRTEWDNTWEAFSAKAAPKYTDSVTKALAASSKFRNIVDRNVFTMSITSNEYILIELDTLAVRLTDITKALLAGISDVNERNVAEISGRLFNKMADLSKFSDPLKTIAKTTKVEPDTTDFFSILDTVNQAFVVLKGNTVNVSEAEYTKQAKFIFDLGAPGIKRIAGVQSDNQKNRFKDIGDLQQNALRKLEQIKRSVGSDADVPEVDEFRKNAIKALTAVSKYYGNMLQYAALEMKYRTELVDVLLTELKNAEGK